jgi:hypothetical protein
MVYLDAMVLLVVDLWYSGFVSSSAAWSDEVRGVNFSLPTLRYDPKTISEIGISLGPLTLRRDPKVAFPNSSPSRARDFFGRPEASTAPSRAMQREVPPLGSSILDKRIRCVPVKKDKNRRKR